MNVENLDIDQIPLLLLLFNRPELVKEQIKIIRKFKPKFIYVASDGPRFNNPEDETKVLMCRKIINTYIDWDCYIAKKYEDVNLGCGVGVSDAITWFFTHVEYGIIIEDDCQLSYSFFSLCAQLLPKYKNNTKIAGISADFKFLKNARPANEYSYTEFPQIWGWATWRRFWHDYDYSLQNWDVDKKWLGKLPTRAQSYWTNNFNKVRSGRVDTWDYQVAYKTLSRGLLFIHPMRNMVKNVGFGSDATHTKATFDPTSNLPIYEVQGPFVENNLYNEYNSYLKERYFINRPLLIKIYKKILMICKKGLF